MPTTVSCRQRIPRDILALVRKFLEGSYTVDREIGRGGAARVFLATDQSGREVALKVLHPELLVSVAADRFLREIGLIRQLDHPHIGRLIDSGERDWLVFYVMPYIEGPTLKQLLLRDRHLTLEATRSLALELLSALGHAHRLGIIHRDVKPDNIVLGAKGAVLVDFGIARAVQLSGSDRVTRSGIAVGTSAYMSPEQIGAEEDIDHRTDLYALGCLLFECLAGRPPFIHRNENVVLQMHQVEAVPDIRDFRGETPVDLDRMITRALAKRREDRWPDAEAMARELGKRD